MRPTEVVDGSAFISEILSIPSIFYIIKKILDGFYFIYIILKILDGWEITGSQIYGTRFYFIPLAFCALFWVFYAFSAAFRMIPRPILIFPAPVFPIRTDENRFRLENNGFNRVRPISPVDFSPVTFQPA